MDSSTSRSNPKRSHYSWTPPPTIRQWISNSPLSPNESPPPHYLYASHLLSPTNYSKCNSSPRSKGKPRSESIQITGHSFRSSAKVAAKNADSARRSSIALPSSIQSQSSHQRSSSGTKRNSNTKNAKKGTTRPVMKKDRDTIGSYLYHTCVSIICTLLCASLRVRSFSHHPSVEFLNYYK